MNPERASSNPVMSEARLPAARAVCGIQTLSIGVRARPTMTSPDATSIAVAAATAARPTLQWSILLMCSSGGPRVAATTVGIAKARRVVVLVTPAVTGTAMSVSSPARSAGRTPTRSERGSTTSRFCSGSDTAASSAGIRTSSEGKSHGELASGVEDGVDAQARRVEHRDGSQADGETLERREPGIDHPGETRTAAISPGPPSDSPGTAGMPPLALTRPKVGRRGKPLQIGHRVPTPRELTTTMVLPWRHRYSAESAPDLSGDGGDHQRFASPPHDRGADPGPFPTDASIFFRSTTGTATRVAKTPWWRPSGGAHRSRPQGCGARGAEPVGFAGRCWGACAYRPGTRFALALGRVISTHRPELAHVHNTWYSLSSSVLSTLRRRRIPTVMTMHNYRVTCLNGQLFRDGAVCQLCLGRPPLPALGTAVTADLSRRLWLSPGLSGSSDGSGCGRARSSCSW